MFGEWWADAALVGLLGLLIGSFLNVVIHRVPRMLEAQWASEYAEFTAHQADSAKPNVQVTSDPGVAQLTQQPVKFNLLVPRSRCPECGHLISWYENIPVLSYLVLRGQCASCKTSIGLRYPAVELVTGALFFFCASRFGWSMSALAWCAFCAVLVALACIDWDTTLLPDNMTLPLVWMGLIVAALHWNPMTKLPDALWGAVGGYMSLWLVYWAFKLVTGKEGMGYGDFKLFAALGAWFGWQALVPIILMSSVIGAVVGIAMKFSSNLREGGYIPFGPFLAGAGLTALIFGPQSILRAVGL